MLANHQTQAGAAVFARRGAVGLRERLKQPALNLGCDADTGVVDRETHRDVLGRFADFFDLKKDLAFLGKLHGVAQQIQEDLAQPPRIAAQSLGNFRRQPANQFDVLDPRCFGQQIQRALDDFA